MSIVRNRWSVRNTLSFALGFCLAFWVGGKTGAGYAMALLGVLVGNQVGCLLQDISRLNRILGLAVLAWNVYDFFTQGIPLDTPYLKGAFLWGFGAMATFSSEELGIFRVRKDTGADGP
jgi:hypothetical protein